MCVLNYLNYIALFSRI